MINLAYAIAYKLERDEKLRDICLDLIDQSFKLNP